MAIRKSSNSGTPFGDTSGRPSSPSVGQTYYNGQLGYLEIYTVSGWIPATGANDFSLNITGLNTTVTFSQTYSSGSYSIVSFLNDATVDVYAYADDGSLAGYSNTKAFTATQRFNKMVVLGGSSGDVLQFSYKTTYATSTSTTDVTAGPYITSITPSAVPNQNDTITITGGNFATDAAVTFTGTGYSATSAKLIVRSSSTSLVVTRPDNLPVSGAPYTITVSNPGVTSPTGSAVNVYSPITAGVVPVWQTATSLSASVYGSAYSASVSATDADGSSNISYSVVSGTLPTGISFSGGEFSGTPTSPTPGTYSYTIRATDSGGNYADRTFTTSYSTISGGTLTSDSTYYYRVFNSTGTLNFGQSLTADILMVGGGGGGGNDVGSGGGAGGVVLKTGYSITPASYSITIGAGGPSRQNSSSADPATNYSGINTTFSNLIAYGGGGAGSWQNVVAAAGGSGGGGCLNYNGNVSTSGGAATQPGSATGGYGNAGGNGAGNAGSNEYSGAAGGGGAGAAGGNGSSNWTTQGDSSVAVGGVGVLISQFSLSGMGDPSFAGWYGGGGGASTDGGGGWSYGGKGGGGDGTNRRSANGTGAGGYYYINGKPNTGGGGGGGGLTEAAPGTFPNSGGAGGSGVFMIRYTKASVGG